MLEFADVRIGFLIELIENRLRFSFPLVVLLLFQSRQVSRGFRVLDRLTIGARKPQGRILLTGCNIRLAQQDRTQLLTVGHRSRHRLTDRQMVCLSRRDLSLVCFRGFDERR
jgi:hypothetical protein